MEKSVEIVVPSALTLPPWARGVTEDQEEPFVGKGVELELVEFCYPGESCVNGEEMLKRSLAKTHPAGGRVVEYLFAHPELIPEEWWQFVLVFAGTVLLDEGGDRHVQCLAFRDGQWDRRDGWLRFNFDSSYRVVGFRK